MSLRISRLASVAVTAAAAAALASFERPLLRAQQPAPGGQGPGRGAITSPRNAYPERAPDDPEAVARGKALYGVNCQFCHGADIRGGDGGPSLLRSGVVLDDQHGELIAPVVQNGRTDRGMPKFGFTNAQVADVAAFLHTFRAAGYDESRRRPPSIVVGDPKAGHAFFAARCGSCHSATGDLRGLASRIDDPRLLQQTWLMPGSGGGRGSASPVKVPPARVVVTLHAGEKVEGVLDRLDDFVVSLTTDAGDHRSFRLSGDTTVEVRDPLKPHMDLLRAYSDTDIHNVTAYLVTLK
ncbi:MAG TPA: c-type cytochrome [Vicinamibacterales bacterium]